MVSILSLETTSSFPRDLFLIMDSIQILTDIQVTVKLLPGLRVIFSLQAPVDVLSIN